MLCLCQTPKIMHGIILYMFDSWANPVVRLLLLKSSMALYFMSQSGSVTANEQLRLPICPIVKQIWLLPFTHCLCCFVITQTQQLTTWEDTSLHLLLLKISMSQFIQMDHLRPLFIFVRSFKTMQWQTNR